MRLIVLFYMYKQVLQFKYCLVKKLILFGISTRQSMLCLQMKSEGSFSLTIVEFQKNLLTSHEYNFQMQTEQKRNVYDLFQISQTDGMNSVNNGFLSAQESISCQDRLSSIISKSISKLLVRQKMRVIKNVMHNLYGRHNPINYRSEFNFQERWQSHNKETTFQQKYSLLKTDNFLYILLHFILYAFYGFTAWFFSVYRLFMVDDSFYIMVMLVVIAKISDAVIKQVYLFQTFAQNYDAKSAFTLKDYLKYHWLGILSLFYLSLICVEQHFLGSTKSRYFFVIDLFFTWRSYSRFKQLYSAIKFKSLSSNYRNEIQIFQLFGGCILLVHIFGLVLYLVSRTNSDKNWTYSIDNFGSNWESRYIYSVYFGCTTALTVGFGDITPKNLFEIVTIMCVQILGIINIGYIVNQIGRVLSKINQGREVLYNNISQTEKIIKNYGLPEYLATKMRSYVINNQIANNELHVEEQDNLINKFKDQMRQKIISINHLKIVKTSVFFICNWTKKFQVNLANKLSRAIYSPQETITQVEGKQKIFILTKGKLQLEACFSSNSSNLKKTLHTLEYDSNKEVQFNVYGYSSCISGLKINIRAIAKDYSICYYATKDDILKIVAQSESDFEYFHQIKVKIQQSRYKEVWQAPNIANTREHYLPNPYYVMKRDRLQFQQTNTRKYRNRRVNKLKCYIQKSKQASSNDLESDVEESVRHLQEESSGTILQCELNNNLLTEKQRMQKYSSIQNNDKPQYMIANRKYRMRYPKIKLMDTQQLQNQRIAKVFNAFEANKHFKVYLPKYNFECVIKKYNKKYGIKQSESILQRSDPKLINMLGQQLIQKILNVQKISRQITPQSV